MTQLRKDIVSGDWIIIASGRAKRPHEDKDLDMNAQIAKMNALLKMSKNQEMKLLMRIIPTREIGEFR